MALCSNRGSLLWPLAHLMEINGLLIPTHIDIALPHLPFGWAHTQTHIRTHTHMYIRAYTQLRWFLIAFCSNWCCGFTCRWNKASVAVSQPHQQKRALNLEPQHLGPSFDPHTYNVCVYVCMCICNYTYTTHKNKELLCRNHELFRKNVHRNYLQLLCVCVSSMYCRTLLLLKGIGPLK